MILAAHQPNYLPWAGYFYKMARCDAFVFLDSVQYSRTSYTARCLIKGIRGKSQWLSVPVFKKGRYFQNISEVNIDNDSEWQKAHQRSLESCYSKAPYFRESSWLNDAAYKNKWDRLSLLNIELIKSIAVNLGVIPKFTNLSELNINSKSSELLIDICNKMSAQVYLSGPGGKKYLDEKKFKEAGIELRFVTYYPQAYPQLCGDFVPGLSIIDMLYNCGPQAVKRIVKADVL
jgi:hypothetical protein